MKKTLFYVCPCCGNVLLATSGADISCCGRTLSPLQPLKADAAHQPRAEQVEDELYITFDHEMNKEHYISFVAVMSYDRVLLIKLYPEQSPELRIPKSRRSRLVFYCSSHGLMEYQL